MAEWGSSNSSDELSNPNKKFEVFHRIRMENPKFLDTSQYKSYVHIRLKGNFKSWKPVGEVQEQQELVFKKGVYSPSNSLRLLQGSRE